MEQQKLQVLKRHYIVKIGDVEIKLPRSYRATEMAHMLISAGYSVSITAIEHECEMTRKEIDIARARDADIMILSEMNYPTACEPRY